MPLGRDYRQDRYTMDVGRLRRFERFFPFLFLLIRWMTLWIAIVQDTIVWFLNLFFPPGVSNGIIILNSSFSRLSSPGYRFSITLGSIQRVKSSLDTWNILSLVRIQTIAVAAFVSTNFSLRLGSIRSINVSYYHKRSLRSLRISWLVGLTAKCSSIDLARAHVTR